MSDLHPCFNGGSPDLDYIHLPLQFCKVYKVVHKVTCNRNLRYLDKCDIIVLTLCSLFQAYNKVETNNYDNIDTFLICDFVFC